MSVHVRPRPVEASYLQRRLLKHLAPPARLRLLGRRDMVRYWRFCVCPEQQIQKVECRCTDDAEHVRAVLVQAVHGAQCQSVAVNRVGRRALDPETFWRDA